MSEPPSPQRPGAPPLEVTAADEQDDVPLDPAPWARLARSVLAHEGVQLGELSLTFVDEATMAELNREHLGAEGSTDVLSFPLDADLDHQPADPDQPVLLGDVVICPAVAARTAPTRLTTEPHPGHPRHDGTLDAELALLVVHGVLHVLGHDHADPEEAAVMQAHEQQLLDALTPEVNRP